MPQNQHRVLNFDAVTDLVAADGTVWSHAATLGSRVRGTSFTIDRVTIDNFVRVFSAGYPQKIPVDYEHGTVNGATDMGQPIPKAGDVRELRGVFAAEDFTGELLEAAKKIAEKAERPLSDPRNLGLWIRWRPTARSLGMIREREYTEMSIAYHEDLPHNQTGEGQGPTLISIALTNLPFLDDMLPVAASRGAGGDRTASGEEPPIMTDPRPNMLARFAAVLGKVFATEPEAVDAAETEIRQLRTQVTELSAHKALSDVVTAELKETDPAKAATKIRELTASAVAAETAAVEATADKVLAKHEKRLTPALQKFFRPQLIRELSAGTAEGKTEVEQAITALPESTITKPRESAADQGADAPTDQDARINERAVSLMQENEEIKTLAQSDRHAAFKRAIVMAARELTAA